ncbi:hypothetical protein OG729_06615 [Streptomyces sp. NBC_00210]|uniref:hypothetical protein n=1 Tax=unclassified Streptomyces TaxID=2593676 RepID=UPI00324550D6
MHPPEVVDVHRRQPWYAARPEPEREFVGTLHAVPPVIGPDNRPVLAFVLRTTDDELSVYASGAEDTLGLLVGPLLRLRGKAVDLTGEGGSPRTVDRDDRLDGRGVTDTR